MNIILIGFMGSGKSSLGKILAKKLNYSFVDSDKVIEQQMGMTITSIFELKGESYFRDLEKQFVNSISKDDNQVIAVGGGTPCFFDNMEQLKEKGLTVYLERPAGELVSRLLLSKNPRPLVLNKTKEELMQYVKETIKEREVFYKKAHHCLDRSINSGPKLTDFIRLHLTPSTE